MKVHKKEISLAEVVKALGMNDLKQDRSIRMRKIKGDGMRQVFTWDKAKRGHDWDPCGGYFKKRAFVKALEQHIDETLGLPGQGKILTKAVGAYSRKTLAEISSKN